MIETRLTASDNAALTVGVENIDNIFCVDGDNCWDDLWGMSFFDSPIH